jgi:hypothetical protein
MLELLLIFMQFIIVYKIKCVYHVRILNITIMSHISQTVQLSRVVSILKHVFSSRDWGKLILGSVSHTFRVNSRTTWRILIKLHKRSSIDIGSEEFDNRKMLSINYVHINELLCYLIGVRFFCDNLRTTWRIFTKLYQWTCIDIILDKFD